MIATLPYERKAFIIDRDKTFFLAPPYNNEYLEEVPLKEVEKAISFYGFEPCELGFNELNEVVEYLKNRYLELFDKRGIELPTSAQLRELIKYAPDYILEDYLKKSDEILIPEGKTDAAKNIASDIIKQEDQRNPRIIGKAKEVLRRCEGLMRKDMIITVQKISPIQYSLPSFEYSSKIRIIPKFLGLEPQIIENIPVIKVEQISSREFDAKPGWCPFCYLI